MPAPPAGAAAAGDAGADAAPSADAHVDEAAADAFVHQRFVDMFVEQNHRSQAGLLCVAGLLAYIWAVRSGAAVGLGWFALALAVTGARFVFTERIVRHADAAVSTRRVGLVMLVNGIVLATPLLAFGRYSDLERAAITIALVASATGSVATTAGYRSIFLAFALPMFLPLSAAWALSGAPTQGAVAALGIAALVMLFLLVLVGVGKQAFRVFDESCRIRFSERQLTLKLSQALERESDANRAKTQFLAAASHDLRQPIHSLNVLVAALSQRPLDERSREIVTLLGSVNQTLSAELDGLLEISKLDAGAVLPELAPLRLDRLAATHHATVAPVAQQNGLECVLSVHDEVNVTSDSTLLTRVLGNLTSNAMKFTRRGGRIELRVWQAHGRALLAVADNGVGIPAEEHERVFREFYQVGNTERDRNRGLGLGLSIVRRSCDLLGVRVHLESTPGVGTAVTLDMPAQDGSAADLRHADVQRRPLPPGLVVLVIDDEAQVRESMRLLLAGMGCVVHLAESTAQARGIAAGHRLHVVLSDMRLRGGDSGLAAMQAVREHQPAVRMALITGDTAPDRIREAQAAGVPLLHKPLAPERLFDLLRAEAAAAREAGASGPVALRSR
ncbi:MAG: response regulator [Burkholderiales bacterium]|nr:response regulator [Burkholderiales bacterium]